jgi:hypothetical protein
VTVVKNPQPIRSVADYIRDPKHHDLRSPVAIALLKAANASARAAS